ncbi:MAG: RNA ligase family protein [Nanoarchaeota archaeon]
MKDYPSIARSNKAPIGEHCIAFYKYDGSNLRWEWSKKKGWNKFGTRNHLFDKNDLQFGQAIPLFLETIAPKLDDIIKQEFKNIDIVTVFTEYFGPSSFAGQHLPDEKKELRLFDVCPHKKCMMNPKDFINIFGSLPFAAQVVYEGILAEQFIDDIRNNKYPVNEGVVCKGGDRHNLWMVKIKTNIYKQKLIDTYGNRWNNYWE